MTFELISQIMIPLISGTAIWFISRSEKWNRWGYIIGICGQPFWYYTSIINNQWGITILACWFTYCWIQGIYNYWIKKQ